MFFLHFVKLNPEPLRRVIKYKVQDLIHSVKTRQKDNDRQNIDLHYVIIRHGVLMRDKPNVTTNFFYDNNDRGKSSLIPSDNKC